MASSMENVQDWITGADGQKAAYDAGTISWLSELAEHYCILTTASRSGGSLRSLGLDTQKNDLPKPSREGDGRDPARPP